MDKPSDFEILTALAELDVRKRDLEALLESLPTDAHGRENDLAERREEFARVETTLQESGRERRRLEGLLEDKNRQLEKYRVQLDEVKTNKEYQSLQNEIAVMKDSISENEDRLLEFMDLADEAGRQIDERRSELASFEEEVERLGRESRERLADAEVQLIEVEEKRARFQSALPPSLRAEYQRLWEHYNGGAFAVAADGVCRGCYVNIPAKVVAELRAGGRLYRCESCGRFIIRVEDE
jgi:predicted  nucleic acid-binding Zn-ribbon protein